MKSTKIHIVEDEPLIAETIRTIVEKKGFEVSGISITGKDALFDIDTLQPDMVLVDIMLKGEMDGVEMATHLKKRSKIPIIFLTSLSDEETMNRVMATHPAAYIVKPFNEHTLITNIELSLYKHKQSITTATTSQSDAFFIKNKGELIKIEQRDILFFEAYDNYCNLYTDQKKHLITHTLKSVEEKLPKIIFLKVHRSYIINVSKIDSIHEGYVFFGRHKVPVSKSYRSVLMAQVNLL